MINQQKKLIKLTIDKLFKTFNLLYILLIYYIYFYSILIFNL